MGDCEVAAVASKSMERAQGFAEKNGIKAAYDSYEKMLAEEKPDCVYIAVTQDAHYALCMLCLLYTSCPGLSLPYQSSGDCGGQKI